MRSLPNRLRLIILIGLLLIAAASVAQQRSARVVNYDAKQFEISFEQGKQVIYLVGDVVFETEDGFIYCDSAVLKPGDQVRLKGRVRIDDPEYRLQADSVTYHLAIGEADAWGESVRIWSFKDSLYAAGTHAFLKRDDRYFFMDNRPTLYLRYPDSAKMVEVIADQIEYAGVGKGAQASGKVTITSNEIATSSGCAVMNLETHNLDLFDKPSLIKGKSTLAGEFITVVYDDSLIKQVNVYDSAQGNFKEPVDSAKGWYDEAVLKGKMITLMFTAGELDSVICAGSAYSWYYPSQKDQNTQYENNVSGDTIYFDIANQTLARVNVVGESIGRYVTRKQTVDDSTAAPIYKADTVDYQARRIQYSVKDSVIALNRQAVVSSGSLALEAEQVLLDTRTDKIEAFSATIDSGLSVEMSEGLHVQTNTIPVVLKDKDEVLYGDYLEYSLKTEKGRILQSKSKYEQGFYYGSKLYREQRKVFYVEDGRYTTCDAEQPHFHFYSANMKLIENEKLIARPVVFYIERLPILALPYYVFPLKRGRHSGILPLEFGQFQREKRYIRNVGYYWAASQYWDVQGAFDYYELQKTVNLNSRVNFAKRYVLNGYISGTSSFVSGYDRSVAQETKSRRWVLSGAYNHTFTPDFQVSSYGQFQSDSRYYTDYSSNLDERLNRSVKSQASFVKKFGTQTSLSGQFSHTDDIDLKARTDLLPDMTLSLPTIRPFGSGKVLADGSRENRWYHGFSLRYTPHLVNYSKRTTDRTTLLRTRREYARIDHNPVLTLPTINIIPYFPIVPSLRYSESWYKIFETDQSDAAGFDEQTTYRTWSYSGTLSANTKLYGTITPGVLGIQAVRHVLTPTIAYSFTPELDNNSFVSSYAGGTSGKSVKSSSISFGLGQLFQAKVGEGEFARAYDVLNLNSGFSYNLEAKTRPISDMFTSFHTSTIPRINVSGNATHTFYKKNSDDYDISKPRLTNFGINFSTQLRGTRFFFDDPATSSPRPTQPLTQPGDSSIAATKAQSQQVNSRPQGWSMTIQYGYGESRIDEAIRKSSSFVSYTLNFNLTLSTSVSYSHRYDFLEHQTTSSAISIQKTLHCWTGSLFWVPTGSNRGFGFRLFVTGMPEIKIDDQYDNFLEGVQRR